MNEILSLMFPLLLTIAIEYAIVQLLNREKIVLLQVCIVNVITNPMINIFYKYVLIKSITDIMQIIIIITLLEFVIWIAEAIMYKFLLKTNWKNAFKYSVTSNLISYLTSFII